MLGDVTVRHPPPWIRDVEEDVDGFPGADENGVFPDEVRLFDAVSCENEKSPCAVNVERVRHRMIGVHLVHEADLDLITNSEFPVDGGVFGAGVAIDELPAHVRGRGLPVDLDHVVFPLDPLRGVVSVLGLAVLMVVTAVVAVLVVGGVALSGRPLLVLGFMPVVVVVLVSVPAAGLHEACREELHAALRTPVGLVARHLWMHRTDIGRLLCRLGEQFHPALRAAARLLAHDLRVHRTDVDDWYALWHAHVHLGDERERLVRRRLEERLDALA